MPQTISRDGTYIDFDIIGSGTPVILIAGATQYRAVDPKVTPLLASLLAQDFSVINFDRRGRGASTDTWPYEPAREIEDIEALIDAHGGEAYLFGMSSGAVLALEAAATLPGKVRGVALYEPPIDPSRSPDDYCSEHQSMARLAAEDRGPEMMEAFMAGVGMPAEALAGFKQSPAWPAFAAVGLTIEHDYRILADARRGDTPPARWAGATMPVLILDGDKSFPFMAAGADWVASALPHAERITLVDQTHEYDPTIVAPVLTVFYKFGAVQSR